MLRTLMGDIKIGPPARGRGLYFTIKTSGFADISGVVR